ncbi:MAG TPA: hypothetical protein VF834_00055 [Streptosporangiaceae bacterium]
MFVTGVCCDRCPGATAGSASRFARRRLLKTAVFQPLPDAASLAGAAGQPYPGRTGLTKRPGSTAATRPGGAAATRSAGSGAAQLYRAVTGEVLDASPHLITIGSAAGERRYNLTADATAWRGGTLEPAAVNPGDEAVIRLLPGKSNVADRVWASIGRVTGTIVESGPHHLIVDEGKTKGLKEVVIPPQANGRIQVRFPNLRAGYLIDVIGLRRRGYLEGLIPATSQPPYRADQVQRQSPAGGRPPDAIGGSAIWHDPGYEPYGVLGLFYPAVDSAARCAEDAAAGFPPGQAPAFRDLPYLAVGSMLSVRNECTGDAMTMPVTGCAPIARLFNDHCVTCQTSPRGRVADLTLASFVALGGELEAGCFNATLMVRR